MDAREIVAEVAVTKKENVAVMKIEVAVTMKEENVKKAEIISGDAAVSANVHAK